MPLRKMPSSGLLSEIEAAIHEENYGRMYLVGDEMVHRASNDNSWLEAVIVVSGYLVKSADHVWNAVDLSKRAALAAPEDSEIQELTLNTLQTCIECLPTCIDRAETAHSIMSVAPVKGKLMLRSVSIMWENVKNIEDITVKKRYLKIAVYYAPADNDVRLQAEAILKSSPDDRPSEGSDRGSIWDSFLNKHRHIVKDA